MNVNCSERQFALIINPLGTPGIKVANPIFSISQTSDNEEALAVVEAMQPILAQLWDLLIDSGAMQAFTDLMIAVIDNKVAHPDGQADWVVKGCTDALAFVNKLPDTQVADKPDYLNVCGHELRREGAKPRQTRTKGIVSTTL